MKNIILVALVVMFSGGFVIAEGKEIKTDVTTDFFSKYIWRGAALNEDPVFQPSVNVSYEKFTATIWGNLEFTDIYGNKDQFTEIDYVLDWTNEFTVLGFKIISYSLGVSHFTFPSTMLKDTTELYAGLTLGFLPLSPSIKANFDVDEAKGTYLQLGLSESIMKITTLAGKPVGLDLGANIGWGSSSYNRYYWGKSDGRFNDLTLSAGFPIEISKNLSIVPSLNYATIFDSGVRGTNAYGDNHNFFAGVRLAYAF